MELRELSETEVEAIEDKLEEYDTQHMGEVTRERLH